MKKLLICLFVLFAYKLPPALALDCGSITANLGLCKPIEHHDWFNEYWALLDTLDTIIPSLQSADLQKAFDNGNVITGVSDQKPFQLAYDDAGTPNSFSAYYDRALKHFVLRFSPAGPFPIILSPGAPLQIVSDTGQTLWSFDPAYGLLLSGVAKATFTSYWNPGDVDVDATKCTAPAAVTILTRPVKGIACSASVGGAIYGSAKMPATWTPSDLAEFTLRLVTADTTTKTWKADLALHCVQPNIAAVIPSAAVFDADQKTTITVTTGTVAGALHEVVKSNQPLNGSCAGGAMLWWRLLTVTGHDATTTLVRDGCVAGKTSTLGY